MLSFDKTTALMIALFYGLAGIPWSFWLFGKDKCVGRFEKIVIGYAIGILLVPFLLLIENFAGILFSTPLMYVDWLIVLVAGLGMLYKDGGLKLPKIDFTGVSNETFMLFVLALIMLSIFFIGFSNTGVPIMDLDPYFYLDGAKQIAVHGMNFHDDGWAWYPQVKTNHLGQPVWKYTLASWLSMYDTTGKFDPYLITGVAGVLAPILGALSAFFAYFLFKVLYKERVGVLAAGLLVFAPIMLVKFQGGDFQIEPYNIFALIMVMACLAYALKRPMRIESAALVLLSFIAVFLGSNVGFFLLFFLTVLIASIGMANYLTPTKEGDERVELLLKVVLINTAVQLIYWLYYVRAGVDALEPLSGVMPYIIGPALAFALPWALKYATVNYFKKDANLDFRVGAFAVVIVLAIFAFVVMQNVPGLAQIINGYVFFGGYNAPLARTIAEQAIAGQAYPSSIGVIAAPFEVLSQDPNTGAMVSSAMSVENPNGDVMISIYNMGIGFGRVVNAIPNAILDFVYTIFVRMMNMLAGFDTFPKVQKASSVFTFVVFFGILGLVASLVRSIMQGKAWAIDAMIILPFAVPVLFMAFGKQKLGMYLAVVVVFLACAMWGNLERGIKLALQNYYKNAKEEREKQHKQVIYYCGFAATILMLVALFFQFGGVYALSAQLPGEAPNALFNAIYGTYGYSAMPLLLNSFVPRIYDDEKAVLLKLEKYCLLAPEDSVCSLVQNWEEVKDNPVLYYNSELCIRSLWPYYGKQPGPDMSVSIGYRCGFVAPYWLDSMRWINKNVDDDDRIISWWDYGHWINFFGEKKAVLRNEHASQDMIGRTAHAYLHADAKELRDTMRSYGARYALIDSEILGSGSSKDNLILGGKYGALNYLGCAWVNETGVEKWPGQSGCEAEHVWEQAFVPADAALQQQCTISAEQQRYGIYGFAIGTNAQGQEGFVPKYCFAQEFSDGKDVLHAYKLGETDALGNLAPLRAEWTAYNGGANIVLTAFYDKKKKWVSEGGELVSGWDERSTAFYDSNVYSGFFLDELEGFDLVYNTPQIRIYKMKDEYWNSEK